MQDLTLIGFCGVDCAVCPDYKNAVCPGCRRSEWPDGDPCPPVRCCTEKGILHCGGCPTFPCPDMQAFFEESESHREAFLRLSALRKA